MAEICAVCNERISWLDVCWPQDGISVHTKCLSIFENDPRRFGGQSNKDSNLESYNAGAVKKVEESLPANHNRESSSLTKFMLRKSGDVIKEGAIKSVVFAKNASKVTKKILTEADKRLGKIENIRTLEDAYEFAAKEIEDNDYKKGLWAKAFSDAEGDEKKQAALYIKYRAEQIIDFLQDLE